MPGAFYRNSSAVGRKEKRERRSEPLLTFGEHPSGAYSDTKNTTSHPERMGTSHGSSASRAWEIRLTPSMLVMLGVLALVTLSFFFLFGLIIGRGSVPPSTPPQLEHLLPPASPAEPENSPEILQEEELRFMTNLRRDPGEDKDESGEQTGQQEAAKPSAENGGKPQTSTSAPSPAQKDTSKYDFVLRVAAFKSAEQADALRAKLEGEGMRTRMVQEKAQKGTWYFVQVLYRGTTDAMQTLRSSLERYGITDSIISSKTPVS